MNWQPIETAPKGNTLEVPRRSDPRAIDSPDILLFCKDGIFIGHYDFYYHPGFGHGASENEPPWRTNVESQPIFNPTHWMPLPAPPDRCPNDTEGDKYHATLPIRKLPNAVKQTTPTNCFRACVATVLTMPIDEVPEACDGAKWDWDAFQDWLAKMNLQAIEMTFLNGGTMYPVQKPVLCIATGPSPRLPGVQHAVVAEFIGLEGFRLLFDPHMDDLWIDGEPTHATFFVKLTSPAPPSTPEKLRADGWKFDFDPQTHFVSATHRLGGKFSLAEIYRGLLKHEDFVGFGQSIAAFLNGHQQ